MGLCRIPPYFLRKVFQGHCSMLTVSCCQSWVVVVLRIVIVHSVRRLLQQGVPSWDVRVQNHSDFEVLEHFAGRRADRNNNHLIERLAKPFFHAQLSSHPYHINRLMSTRKQEAIPLTSCHGSNVFFEWFRVDRQFPLVDPDLDNLCATSLKPSYQRTVCYSIFLETDRLIC